MKYIFYALVIFFMLGVAVYASPALLPFEKVSEVGYGADSVNVYKVVDKTASTTCYITSSKSVFHAISCVK